MTCLVLNIYIYIFCMTLQEKYKFLNLGWSTKTRLGSWENGPQEKEGLNNINNVTKPTL